MLSVKVTWDFVGIAEGFVIRRRIPGSPYAEIARTVLHEYRDTTVEFGKTYVYGITAYNIAGESTPMVEKSAYVTVPLPPAVTNVETQIIYP